MSLLEVGKACSKCSTIDFLPFTCPSCNLTFCRSHVHSHGCSLPTPTEHNTEAGPSSFNRKITCDYMGCSRPRIEAIAGIEHDEGERIAKQVRCNTCKGAFCTTHRSQDSHKCTGPLEVNARQDAFLDRKAKAQKIIAEKFPTISKSRIINPLPPQKDVIKSRPKSPERLPPSLQPTLPPSAPTASVEVKTKSKAEKMHEIELRKLRSLAQPLEAKMRSDGERRFFQWRLGSREEVEQWEKGEMLGKEKKMNKVWVPATTPVGKVLDLIMTQSKIPRSTSQDSSQACPFPPSYFAKLIPQTYSIVCLSDSPSGGRSVVRTKNELPASELAEGSSVFLVKGLSE